MKPVYLKKYCYSIRIIIEGLVEDYEDVNLNTSHFKLKSIARIISEIDIIYVHNYLFTY